MIPILQRVNSFNTDSEVAILRGIIDDISRLTPDIKYTNILPTADSISYNQTVIYDDGAGTKRIYVKTGEGNIGYTTLT